MASSACSPQRLGLLLVATSTAACVAAGSGLNGPPEPGAERVPAILDGSGQEIDEAVVDRGQEAGAESAATVAAEVDPEAQAAEEPSVPIRGQLSARYRLRATGGEDDHDLYGTLTLDIGDATRNPYSAHVMAWSSIDLDEQTEGDDQSAFFDINDTYDDRVVARLYYAYVDMHDVDSLETLRLGRQQIFETPEVVTFDGARVETEQAGDRDLQFGLYGGIPVHFFESSPSGDAVVGTFVQARPWKGGRVRFDWMHLEDDFLLGNFQDDLLALGVWQSLGEKLRLEADYSWLEGEDRDLIAKASYIEPEANALVDVSYYRQFETERQLAHELDPLSPALLESFPFHQARLLVSKGVGEHLSLEAGFDIRRVTDSADVGQFNRDFERYNLRTSLIDLPQEGLTVSLIGEVWNGTDSDARTWGADVTKEWTDRLDVSLGSYYYLYKADFVSVEERENVRAYYFDMDYDQTENLSFDLNYEFEQGEFDDYHVLRLGLRWCF